MRDTRRLVLYFLAHIPEDSECPGVNDDRPSRKRLERAIRERFGFFMVASSMRVRHPNGGLEIPFSESPCLPGLVHKLRPA